MDEPNRSSRRPLRSRSTAWAAWLARNLIATSITPNQISLLSIIFAMIGSGLMLFPEPLAWIAAAACIQLRLLCNLMDGMVAIEGNRASAVGVLYNEFPDRVADSMLLVALGYAAEMGWLGWLCALLAALTAYIRLFGASVGQAQDFGGLLSKPKRMALLTVTLIAAAIEHRTNGTQHVLGVGLIIMATGTAFTCVSRTRKIVQSMRGI